MRWQPFLLGMLLAFGPCFAVWAQVAAPTPRIIDTNRLDNAAPKRAKPDASVAAAPPAAARDAIAPFTLASVRLYGSSVIAQRELAAISAPYRGQRIGTKEVHAIADAISAAYATHDLALYSIVVADQDFTEGVLRLQAVEGSITEVVIEGDTDGADLSLLQAYGAKIAQERPLRQSTLERYLLLAQDIPGLRFDSRFENAGEPGDVRLRLNIARQRTEFGAGANNQGAGLLGRTQFDASLALHSLLRQGDRTQLIYGFPQEFDRYRFYGISHAQPLGTEGMRLSATLGYLDTQPSSAQQGTAKSGSVQLSYPLIRSVEHNLNLSVSADTLDSTNAVIGETIANEHTRVLRTGISGSRLQDDAGFSSASLVASFGLDAFGAKQGTPAFGDPSFTKISAQLAHDQPIAPFTLRARISGQYAAESLPSSEQFLYGGAEYGRGFNAAEFAGDQGVAGYLELAYGLPFGTAWISTPELYGFADGARLWNENPLLPGSSYGASAGAGMRVTAMEKAVLQLELAKPVADDAPFTTSDGWRVLFSVRSVF